MNIAPLLTSVTLLAVALLFVIVSTANLEPNERWFPTSEERGSVMACAFALLCAFAAGMLL